MALAAFPAEGIATLRMPNSTHMETAQERPRALNEPVGLMPSSLTQNRARRASAKLGGVHMGVMPSPSETMLDGSRTGNTGAYRHMLRGGLPKVVTAPGFFRLFQIVENQQRSAAFAQVVNFSGLAALAADAAFQMSNGSHVEARMIAVRSCERTGWQAKAPAPRKREPCNCGFFTGSEHADSTWPLRNGKRVVDHPLRKRKWLRKILIGGLLLTLSLYALCAICVLGLRWINPPTTAVQMERRAGAIRSAGPTANTMTPFPSRSISPICNTPWWRPKTAGFARITASTGLKCRKCWSRTSSATNSAAADPPSRNNW